MPSFVSFLLDIIKIRWILYGYDRVLQLYQAFNGAAFMFVERHIFTW